MEVSFKINSVQYKDYNYSGIVVGNIITTILQIDYSLIKDTVG